MTKARKHMVPVAYCLETSMIELLTELNRAVEEDFT